MPCSTSPQFFHSFPVCAQLRWLRGIFLMGAATLLSREGIFSHLLLQFSMRVQQRFSNDGSHPLNAFNQLLMHRLFR